MSAPEATLTIRPGSVLAAIGVAEGLCLVAALGFSQLAPDPSQAMMGSILGVAVVGALFSAGAFLIASGKPRPATTLSALWLGAVIGRVMGLLVVVVPLYFAAPQILVPFLIGAGGAYLACLAAETAMIARQAFRPNG